MCVLAVQGMYGACGMLGNCLDSPNYITNAYLSSPSNPFWTAEFSVNLTVRCCTSTAAGSQS